MNNVISRKLYDKIRESHRKGMTVADISKKFNLNGEIVRLILSEDFENLNI